MGFVLTIALTLAAAGIFISLATETQVERFESDQAMAQAGRVSEFISNYNVETRDPAEPGTELQSIVQQAADISGLRITTFDAQGNVVADSNPPYTSNSCATLIVALQQLELAAQKKMALHGSGTLFSQ